MKQILRPVGYMVLVLIGGIVQITSTVAIKFIGVSYTSDINIYLLSFIGVFIISLIVFEVSVIANLRSKTKPFSATVQRSTYNRAIESGNIAIQNLRLKLADTEKELTQERERFEKEQQDSLKKANEKAESELAQERQRFEKEQQDNLRKANENAEGELAQERQKFENKQRESLKRASDKAESGLAQERQKLENKLRDSLKKADENAESKFERERQKFEKVQRDNLRKANEDAERKLAQERLQFEKEQQDNLKKANENAEHKLTQERLQFEKEQRESLKKANEKAESKLAQERQNLDHVHQNHIETLEQEMNYCIESISTDITNGDTFILVSKKAWKKAGDSNEIQQWAGLFSKIKNPSLRSQQENPVGDGCWVYPRSRSSDGRRVMYFREKKEITIIKVCEFFRHDKYEDFRQDGDMKSSKYKELDFSYVPLENAT